MTAARGWQRLHIAWEDGGVPEPPRRPPEMPPTFDPGWSDEEVLRVALAWLNRHRCPHCGL